MSCVAVSEPEHIHIIITDPENNNKMADAYQLRKHIAFIAAEE